MTQWGSRENDSGGPRASFRRAGWGGGNGIEELGGALGTTSHVPACVLIQVEIRQRAVDGLVFGLLERLFELAVEQF
jgi:hypothetical protein